jgi:molybdopterin-guanine dinucleotide biosynthesis protein A/rhodanese-related sulfurtransferase
VWFAGAVLCGGRSSRMGVDKAFLVVDGRPLVVTVTAALRGAGAGAVRAVGGDAANLIGLGIDPVEDRWPGDGPLGGIATALGRAGRFDLVAVLACDLPGATAAGVRRIVTALDAAPLAGVAVPVVDGRREPLFAAWRPSVAAPVVTRLFRAGERAVHRVLDAAGAVEVTGFDPAEVRNVNRPADLGEDGPMSDAPQVPEIDVDELARLHGQGVYVLDVREPDEYTSGHVPGAVPIPLGEVEARAGEVPTDRDVYVVCGSGGRSARAAGILNAQGARATNVMGGTKGWIAAGNPVTEGDQP